MQQYRASIQLGYDPVDKIVEEARKRGKVCFVDEGIMTGMVTIKVYDSEDEMTKQQCSHEDDADIWTKFAYYSNLYGKQQRYE